MLEDKYKEFGCWKSKVAKLYALLYKVGGVGGEGGGWWWGERGGGVAIFLDFVVLILLSI